MKPWCGMSGKRVKEARMKIPEKVLENLRISPRCEISRVKCAAVRWLEKKREVVIYFTSTPRYQNRLTAPW